jgi:hypothetical protein
MKDNTNQITPEGDQDENGAINLEEDYDIQLDL